MVRRGHASRNFHDTPDTNAREYTQRKGETHAVADAPYEMEQPRTSADAVPTKPEGALLALGDRFDLLASMFALGAKPTGSSDPFGLRRAALGLVRILREVPGMEKITVRDGLEAAVARIAQQGVEVADHAVDAAEEFTIGHFAQLLRDEGHSAGLVQASLPAAGTPGRAAKLLREIDASREALPGYLAEQDLAVVIEQMKPVETAAQRFFVDILVNTEDPELRAARQGLLASVLAKAPEGIDWKTLDGAHA